MDRQNSNLSKYKDKFSKNVYEILEKGDVDFIGNLKFSLEEYAALRPEFKSYVRENGRLYIKGNAKALEGEPSETNIESLLDENQDKMTICSRGKKYYRINELKPTGETYKKIINESVKMIELTKAVQPINDEEKILLQKISLMAADMLLNYAAWLPYCILNAYARRKEGLSEKTLDDYVLLGHSGQKALAEEEYKTAKDKIDVNMSRSVMLLRLASDVFVEELTGINDHTNKFKQIEKLLEPEQIELNDIFSVYSDYRLREGDNNFENYMHAVNVAELLINTGITMSGVVGIMWGGTTSASILTSVLQKRDYPNELSFVKFSRHEPYVQKRAKTGGEPINIQSEVDKELTKLEENSPLMFNYYKTTFGGKDWILADDVFGTGRTMRWCEYVMSKMGAGKILTTAVEVSLTSMDFSGASYETDEGKLFAYKGVKELVLEPSFKHSPIKKKNQYVEGIIKQHIQIEDIEPHIKRRSASKGDIKPFLEQPDEQGKH